MALLLLTGCKKSEEEMQLEEFLQTHYPATKVKIINISKLDSIYDPFNAVSNMLRNGNYRSEEKPDFGTVLDDNINPKNAIIINIMNIPIKQIAQSNESFLVDFEGFEPCVFLSSLIDVPHLEQ